MNSLDLTILIIMSITILISTFRGVIREIFSLASVIVGFMAATYYYKDPSQGFIHLTEHAEINAIVTCLLIFIFVAVMVSFIGGRISGMVRKSKLKALDVALGTALGALKGLLISALVIYLLMVFLPAKSPIFTKSKAFPYMSKITDAVSPIGSGFFRDELGRKLEEFKNPAKAEDKKPEPKKEDKKEVVKPAKTAGKKETI